MLENTEGTIKMENREKLAQYCTQVKDKKKNICTTQYVLGTIIRKQTQITLLRHQPFLWK